MKKKLTSPKPTPVASVTRSVRFPFLVEGAKAQRKEIWERLRLGCRLARHLAFVLFGDRGSRGCRLNQHGDIRLAPTAPGVES